MRKVFALLAIVIGMLIITACGKPADKRLSIENRASLFASWAEPKARCVALTTARDLKDADTALCEIKGTNHWCIAPANDAPSCKPYGAPPPEASEAKPAAPAQPAPATPEKAK